MFPIAAHAPYIVQPAAIKASNKISVYVFRSIAICKFSFIHKKGRDFSPPGHKYVSSSGSISSSSFGCNCPILSISKNVNGTNTANKITNGQKILPSATALSQADNSACLAHSTCHCPGSTALRLHLPSGTMSGCPDVDRLTQQNPQKVHQ